MNHLRLAPQLLDLSITNYITHTHSDWCYLRKSPRRNTCYYHSSMIQNINNYSHHMYQSWRKNTPVNNETKSEKSIKRHTHKKDNNIVVIKKDNNNTWLNILSIFLWSNVFVISYARTNEWTYDYTVKNKITCFCVY